MTRHFVVEEHWLAQRGIRVHVLTATRGEAGSCGEPPLCDRDILPTVREQELRCSCAALGIEPPSLLYYPDGMLSLIEEEEAVSQVLAVMQALRPQVLLTWPPDGLSGHPDHVAVSRWTTLAFQQTTAWKPEHAPIALYHLAVPRSVAETLKFFHLHAIPDEEITLTVDVNSVWDQKLAAIRCHRTQLGQSPILSAPMDQQRLFLGQEHFRRAANRKERDFMMELGENQ
jgi:LmbE family N-acetylglucosaminyl deacetylase